MLGGNPTSAPATSLLYAGEQFDIDAQMYYLRARYYDQNNGRFNRTDPWAGSPQDPQSLHKYLYCHNNPVNGIDPSGRFAYLMIGIISVIGALLSLGYLYFQHTVRSLSRIVPVRISVDPDGKPATWNTAQIEYHLKKIMEPCFNHTPPDQGVRLEVVEEQGFSRQLDWTVENGVRVEYNGRVHFDPSIGLAYSPGDGNTYINVEVTENQIFEKQLTDVVDWDIYWANALAHEQIWLSVCSFFGPIGPQFDIPWAPEGDIRSGTQWVNKYANIPESACKEILRSMRLKHR
ncbi:MAG: RHS repeat-associated core domain-containing protein [Planctomycetota bacterium]|nr:MAG: RHS repeat-associated core domain-containing protein [Planctomycetota bacterium]